MPELAPYVSDAETWSQRRDLYASLFDKPDTLLLLARDGDELIGYALAHVLPVGETWVPDTWRTGARIAEIESLAVTAERRGEGIRSALMDAVERELAARGLDDVILGVLPGNADAIRLYERRGFRPTWMYMSRFAGR